MKLRLSILLTALAVGLVASGQAQARGGHDGGPQAAAGFDRSDVPARVRIRVKRAEKALNRAEDRIDDGDDAGSALAAVRRNLAKAEAAAGHRIGEDSGPASAWWVSKAEDDVITSTSALFDGADDTLVADLADTLNAAIDGRDGLIAALAALSSDDQQDYADVLDQISSDVADEIDAIDEALADDTLTSSAQDALTAAREKLVATQDAVETQFAALDTASDDESDGEDTGDCPGHHDGSQGSQDEESGPVGGRRGGGV